jgi:hypothetical protein
MPFKHPEERVEANKMIDDFLEIIEDEKTKNTAFSKKIEDINFEVLLSRPPAGKYRHKTIDNFDAVDNQERCNELWKQWEDLYSWKDDNKDLIDQAVSAKSNKKKMQANQGLFAYIIFHGLFKLGIKTYPDSHFNILHGRKVYQTLRFSKYAVFGVWLFSYYTNAKWFLQELKNVDIYDYKIKRQRLFYHM